jgi:DNA-binding transcriptional LysR family regulator
MDFKKLRYFAVTAQEGSFHRASMKLRIAQPALSRQIRDLEDEIGARLFIRSSQGVTLARAGEVLLAEVERLLPQIELAKETARRAGLGQYGVLRIGLSTVVAEMRFAIAAIAEAGRRNPDVDYRLSVVTSDHQVPALERGDLDLGLHYRRAPLPANMKYRDLLVDKYVLAVPKGHRLIAQSKVWLRDLEGEELIFASRATRPVTHDELLRACLKGGLSPRIAPQFEGEEIMLNLVSQGMALAFFNSAMSRRRSFDDVAFLPIEDLDITLTLAAMWNADRETPAIHDLIDLLIEHMQREEASRNA